jgi:hypothetical protein
MKKTDRISLADTVSVIIDELNTSMNRAISAIQARDGQRVLPLLKLTELHIETEVAVEREESVTGKLSAWIGGIDSGVKNGSRQTQKVTLKLTSSDIAFADADPEDLKRVVHLSQDKDEVDFT